MTARARTSRVTTAVSLAGNGWRAQAFDASHRLINEGPRRKYLGDAQSDAASWLAYYQGKPESIEITHHVGDAPVVGCACAECTKVTA